MPRICHPLLGFLAILVGCRATPGHDPHDPYDSGGSLLPEQAAYDVIAYDLAVEIFPDRKAIRGTLTATARVGSPISWFVLDLDPLLDVSSVEAARGGGTLGFERRGGRLWIALGTTRQPGETVAVKVAYGGTPREAVRAPWDGGFTWAKTPSGAHWIATTCQGEGADVWWPVKDHVSDEPDSMEIHITVPEPLVAASNGRLDRVEDHGDGRRTYHWHVSTPINAYNVALNIAPYETIEGELTSVAGETFAVTFWVLPEDVERGRVLFEEILAHLRFYEETVGPYPFRADKYGVAQTPHMGMEHQTIIAYGGKFDNATMTIGVDWGFDVLHHHELSHEWWGNLVTNADWKDMWLHEGFGTYMQCLYIEKTQGGERYREYLRSLLPRISNVGPLASRESLSASGVYGGDIYFKGAWVLHTLRFLIGDDALRTALRRMAYPTPELEKVTDGGQCRFATTDDFVLLVERITGGDLGWFFEVYARQPELPRLHTRRRGGRLELRWDVPDEMSFPMPIEVRLGEDTRRVEIPAGGATIDVPEGSVPVVDPDAWVLRQNLLEH